ncbi:Hypothetical Protein FCC1311_086962 [Hondaea fermentalgiana]|uniref:EF-hand domain-containing protein n=1 Tax=Hondaea fermentalgiana TaxID=2315210 RepID=A0A2R5GVN8_9STRA|nr:Hypothetical Protein FCC1311_086962 [Hondaea fermentalgiana]|eukprot:GBG32471.1 Hypothetical Protein FCC1311_086962 [Hondaea fermentalgiana]
MAKVLENSVRADMEERDARLLAERDRLEQRRRAMRKQVASALEGLPRLRVVSTTQLRKHLDPEVTAEGHIDRASFVSALRSSGLTNQTNLLSRIFSSFDMDDRNAIFVCDFLDFYTALRKRVQVTTAIAPSVLFMAD